MTQRFKVEPQVLTEEELELKAKCMGSLLFFTQFFYELRNHRPFFISQPQSNEPHVVTVCREFVKCFELQTSHLMINLPPGWGKSELCKHFVAWSMAMHPDSNFLYVSHSVELATKHAHGVKQIMEHPMYQRLFGVKIRDDSSAKDHFTTIQGGVVSAWGAKGGITGYDAGLPEFSRFSGALIIDDIHKPDEVHSDTIRNQVKRNYLETLERRLRSPKVPIIFIGQRLHEDDLPGNLLGDEKSDYVGFDGHRWRKVVIKALDDCGNALYPELHSKEMLANLEKVSPYVYASQYQQDPQPAGGGIFKPSWFVALDEEPEMMGTFLTVDSAETSKTYNDATAMSFFGLYRLKDERTVGDIYALHWIDCREIWIEPKDLEKEFMNFFTECCYYPVKPQLIAIEKKSTGVTLSSTLSDMRGCRVITIDRTQASGSKMNRFLGMQPIVAARRISLPMNGKHNKLCIEHMRKITANDTHKRDDICDTLEMGIKIGLIDNLIQATMGTEKTDQPVIASKVMSTFRKALQIRKRSSFRR